MGEKYNKQEECYKYEVEKDGDYEYIRSFRAGDTLPNGKIVDHPWLQVKHKYCEKVYVVTAGSFINKNQRCSKCCGSYENSFAYHIEVELCEPLEKYWDFEKNTVNPYHISKNRNSRDKKGNNLKVWIKCGNTEIDKLNGLMKKEYHKSYETSCCNFLQERRCPYCANQKVHPKDSFAQYHIKNTDPNFLEKYWDYDKNTVSPWEISINNKKKVWIKCNNEEVNKLNGLMKKEYHESYEIRCSHFTDGVRCPYCYNRKVHPYDSFGYHNFDKVQSWHPDNKISPFRVSKGASTKKYKFVCETCRHEWNVTPAHINNTRWCPSCNMSKGEKKIRKWLFVSNIDFNSQKTYDDLIGLGGRNLSYDFYLPDYNLLIEYQGEFHDNTIAGSYKYNFDFKKQQEHDRRKKQYAKDNNIELLEIWYWDFDNMEEILNEKLHSKQIGNITA